MQDIDPNSTSRSRHSSNLNTIPLQESSVMSSSAIRQEEINQDERVADIKSPKLEADEALGDTRLEDVRPAVFTSTFWEVCAIASLVCGQLTNVIP